MAGGTVLTFVNCRIAAELAACKASGTQVNINKSAATNSLIFSPPERELSHAENAHGDFALWTARKINRPTMASAKTTMAIPNQRVLGSGLGTLCCFGISSVEVLAGGTGPFLAQVTAHNLHQFIGCIFAA